MTPPPIDFVLLTGFLGSGKTTLLADYLAGPEAADTAVIVNEVGEIGLDEAILRESGGPVPMAMMANGCVCCQIGSDLADTIGALLAAERPGASGPLRRIVLETSGLSKPGPVLRTLATLAFYPLRVSVLATYDAVAGMRTADFEEAAAQWAAANRIVLTKADLATPDGLARAREEIAGLNPLAEIVSESDRERTVGAAFAPLAATGFAEPAPPKADATHPRVAVCLARQSRVPSYDELAGWFDNLAGALGDRLLRLKGLARVTESERALLCQSVGTLFAPPRPFGAPGLDARPFLVVIARDLRRSELEEIMPANLFSFESSIEPSRFARAPSARRLRAEQA